MQPGRKLVLSRTAFDQLFVVRFSTEPVLQFCFRRLRLGFEGRPSLAEPKNRGFVFGVVLAIYMLPTVLWFISVRSASSRYRNNLEPRELNLAKIALRSDMYMYQSTQISFANQFCGKQFTKKRFLSACLTGFYRDNDWPSGAKSIGELGMQFVCRIVISRTAL